MNGRYLHTERTIPSYNIALEHALHHLSVTDTKTPILRFWKNNRAVIVGRVQNIFDEVNLQYCEQQRIEVLRRISGGGTVYHDLGNLNSSLILPISKFPTEKNVQAFSRFCTEMMRDTLLNLGLDTIRIEAGTNLFFHDRKISGSAGHLRSGWFLHHATLLFNTNLEMLNQSILARDSYPKDTKRSRYFPTTNLTQISQTQWMEGFRETCETTFDIEFILDDISKREDQYALKLRDELYLDNNWIVHGKRKLIKPD